MYNKKFETLVCLNTKTQLMEDMTFKAKQTSEISQTQQTVRGEIIRDDVKILLQNFEKEKNCDENIGKALGDVRR